MHESPPLGSRRVLRLSPEVRRLRPPPNCPSSPLSRCKRVRQCVIWRDCVSCVPIALAIGHSLEAIKQKGSSGFLKDNAERLSNLKSGLVWNQAVVQISIHNDVFSELARGEISSFLTDQKFPTYLANLKILLDKSIQISNEGFMINESLT